MSDNDFQKLVSQFDEDTFYNIDQEDLISDTISENMFEMENVLVQYESGSVEENQSENERKPDESIIGKKVQIQILQKDKQTNGQPLSTSASQLVKVSPKHFITQQELQQTISCEIVFILLCIAYSWILNEILFEKFHVIVTGPTSMMQSKKGIVQATQQSTIATASGPKNVDQYPQYILSQDGTVQQVSNCESFWIFSTKEYGVNGFVYFSDAGPAGASSTLPMKADIVQATQQSTIATASAPKMVIQYPQYVVSQDGIVQQVLNCETFWIFSENESGVDGLAYLSDTGPAGSNSMMLMKTGIVQATQPSKIVSTSAPIVTQYRQNFVSQEGTVQQVTNCE